jgi:hypothetical protein
MPKEIYTSFTTGPRTEYERNHPINIYGLGLPDQSFRVSTKEAWELVRCLVSTLEGHYTNRS